MTMYLLWETPLAGCEIKSSLHCRREALHMWMNRNGDKATYRALIEIFIKADKREHADFICTIIEDMDSSGI